MKKEDSFKATTKYDITEKNITPMGGFIRYGIIREDYLVVKGCIPGPKKRVITLRRSLIEHKSKRATEKIDLKFISTASQIGHGRFQTHQEKLSFFGKDIDEPEKPAMQTKTDETETAVQEEGEEEAT